MIAFSWTLTQSLEMPARSFFSLVRASRELKSEERNWFLMELCDVAACATGIADYHSKLKEVYFQRVFPGARIPSGRPVVDLTDPDKTKSALAGLLGGFSG